MSWRTGGTMMAAALACACGLLTGYEGDGRLSDHGPFAATDRYVLDLGQVDPTRVGSKTYQLKDLPREKFVVGFEIQATTSVSMQDLRKRLTPVIVSVELVAVGTGKQFKKVASLNEWTWSLPRDEPRAFVYSRDVDKTYFEAAPNGDFVLTVGVLRPLDAEADFTMRLVAKSSGWK